MTDPRPGAPGSLADEAIRLIEAIGLIADARGSDHRHGRYGGPAPGQGADGSEPPECRICPICRLIAAVRQLRPEVLTHLVAAGEELLAAAREFAASGATPGAGPGATPGAGSGATADGSGPASAGADVAYQPAGGDVAGPGLPLRAPRPPARRPERIELD